MLGAGRDHGAVAVADLAFGQEARLDLRRQQTAADEVVDHVFPYGRHDGLAVCHQVERVGIAVGELDVGRSSLK